VSEYYTAKEAADVLGLKYTTLIARAKSGKLPWIGKKHARLFPKEEIHKYADDRSVGEAGRAILLPLDEKPDGQVE